MTSSHIQLAVKSLQYMAAQPASYEQRGTLFQFSDLVLQSYLPLQEMTKEGPFGPHGSNEQPGYLS
jgi:hypothetical protein